MASGVTCLALMSFRIVDDSTPSEIMVLVFNFDQTPWLHKLKTVVRMIDHITHILRISVKFLS